MSILDIQNITIGFKDRYGFTPMVRDLSFSVKQGEVLSIVGESGCGKSITAYSILRLMDPYVSAVEGGGIFFHDQNLLTFSEREMQRIRGKKISMIFQEPMSSLNPVFSVGAQLTDVCRLHAADTKKQAWTHGVDLLKQVHIPSASECMYKYPHELSGGMRQRVLIALSLASPDLELLIADEPTTALDVTIQAQILNLLDELRKETGLALLMITHDLGVVATLSERVMVMYAGRKVEEGSLEAIIESPHHPYSHGLLASLPTKQHKNLQNNVPLYAIPGSVPSLKAISSACPFAERCDHADDVCSKQFPENTWIDTSHSVWCYHPQGLYNE